MSSIDLEQFLETSAIDRQTLTRWIELRWLVIAQDSDRIALTEVDAARALFIRDLTHELDVNDAGVSVALHLVDQVHGLRRALAELRGELGTPSPR